MWGVHSGIGAWIGLGDFGDWGNMGKFEDAWKLKLVTIASIVSYMHNLLIIRFYKTLFSSLPFPAQCSIASNKCGTKTAGSSVAGK